MEVEDDIDDWYIAEALLKTYTVVQDGEVEKWAKEYALKKHESVKPEAEDFEDEREYDYQDAKGAYDFVFDESVEDFKEGFLAHAQKYGFNEEDMRKCWDAGAAYADTQNGVYYNAPDKEDYMKSLNPTYTVGQKVECEVDEEKGIAWLKS